MKTFGALVALLLLAGCAGTTPVASETAPRTEVTQPDPNQAEVYAAPEEGAAEEAEPETSGQDSSETEPTETATAEPDAPAETQAPAVSPKPTATPKPTTTPKPTATPEPTVTAGPVFVSKAEVAKNNSRSSCWVIIDGSVYDLTRWISQHPGGAGNILNLCGTDGSTEFSGMHGGEARPSSVLKGYFLAELER